MSTYYAFSCDDCEESSGRAFNHEEDRAKALLKIMPCIINIEQEDPWLMFEVDFADRGGEPRDLVAFAKQHWGHKLRVVTEYDRYNGVKKIDISGHKHRKRPT